MKLGGTDEQARDFRNTNSFKIALLEMLPKIKNFEIYIDEALKSEYYEDLHYLKKLIF